MDNRDRKVDAEVRPGPVIVGQGNAEAIRQQVLGQGSVVLSPVRLVATGEVRSATLLTQAIVLPYNKTSEGLLISAVSLPWLEIVKKLRSEPSFAFQIDARKWEEIIAAAYDLNGFDEVTLTPRSGDLGRDVIAVKHGVGCVRFIESVKRYSPDYPVTADDVRSLLGVLLSDQNATKGIVTTTSTFAPMICSDPFIQPHVPFRLELVDGQELHKRLSDLADKQSN